MEPAVNRRAVFFVGGYDPKSPMAFFDRLAREAVRFDALSDVETRFGPIEIDGNIGKARLETSGQGWRVETDFHFLGLDSLVLTDFAQPLPVRLWKYLVAFADFVASGTAFRIFASAWRFGLYFLFPFFMLLMFALLGRIAVRLTAPWLGWTAWLLGLAVFALALTVLGERWPVHHLMDLWSFSRNFLRGRRPDAEALMQRDAEILTRIVREGAYDEVLLVGHSTGGVLILDLAARCIRLDPAFSSAARSVAVLTLGSTALKVGYHPAASDFRDGVQALVDDGKLEWVEIQCLTDIINLYKTDPVTEMKLSRAKGRAFPLIRTVRIRDMLEPETYKRIRRSFFRVHYQYIFGNTRPYWYDFFQIVCGPTALLDRARAKLVGATPAGKT